MRQQKRKSAEKEKAEIAEKKRLIFPQNLVLENAKIANYAIIRNMSSGG